MVGRILLSLAEECGKVFCREPPACLMVDNHQETLAEEVLECILLFCAVSNESLDH